MADFCERGDMPRRVSWGLIGGTKVETEAGWRCVEDLRPGTMIHTYDGGLRPLKAVYRTHYGANLRMAFPEGLILVPGGVLGNCEAFYLLPDQHVMVGGSAVEGVTGKSTVLLAGAHIAGHGGMSAVMPVDEVAVFSLSFDDEEVIFVNTGVLIHCPRPGRMTDDVSDCFAVGGPDTAAYLMACRFFDKPTEVSPEIPVEIRETTIA